MILEEILICSLVGLTTTLVFKKLDKNVDTSVLLFLNKLLVWL